MSHLVLGSSRFGSGTLRLLLVSILILTHGALTSGQNITSTPVFTFPNYLENLTDVLAIGFRRAFAVSLGPLSYAVFDSVLPSPAVAEETLEPSSFSPSFNNGGDASCFDFIIVGAGSAGSVVASRLSKYYSVLLLEPGGPEQAPQRVPLLAMASVNHEAVDYQYQTVPQTSACLALNNQSSRCSQGKGLGGSGNLNFMVYLRGHPKDYDNWANLTGDRRWAYDGVRPFFLNSTQHGPARGTNDTRMNLEFSTFSPLEQEFLEAAAWDGIPTTDVNEPYGGGAGAFPSKYTTLKGQRHSSYTAYVKPVESRKTLTILKYSWVYKILFKEGTTQAYGVEYEREGKRKVACASKEIIVSAGALNSPKLLMLSGIGPKERLDAVGIKTLVDLPVGKNLRDHVSAMLGPFIIDKQISLLLESTTPEDITEFWARGTGKLTQSSAAASLFYASSRARKAGHGDWPDVQNILVPAGATVIFPALMSNMFNIPLPMLVDYYNDQFGKDGFHILVLLVRPEQAGELWIPSRDHRDPPIIDPMYFKDRGTQEFEVMVEALKRAVNMSENAPAFKVLGAKLNPTPLPPCRHTAFRSDPYWECFARQMSTGFWHFTGTTAMGKVVDSELNVFNTTGLRVIDAGVMPMVVGANTNAATIMIGERGAELILNKWGLPPI